MARHPNRKHRCLRERHHRHRRIPIHFRCLLIQRFLRLIQRHAIIRQNPRPRRCILRQNPEQYMLRSHITIVIFLAKQIGLLQRKPRILRQLIHHFTKITIHISLTQILLLYYIHFNPSLIFYFTVLALACQQC